MSYYYRPEDALAIRALDARAKAGGIRCLILEGPPGVGKTALGYAFAEERGGKVEYYLCHRWTSDEELFIGVDVGRVAAGVSNADEAYRPGVLMRAVKASAEGLVVVIIDEIDKAPEAVEALLLDFLQTGRVYGPRGECFQSVAENIVVFITTNGLRPMLEATLRRGFRLRMTFLPPEVEADIIRKATGAPIGAIRVVVRMGNVIRSNGATAVSLQEMRNLLRDMAIAQTVEDVQSLILGWLVKESADWEALVSEFKNPAAILWGEWRRGHNSRKQ